MKLKFFLNKGKKEYTLKEEIDGEKTKDAHYKFINVRDAPKSNAKFVRRK